MKQKHRKQTGFSLVETLFSLLLFSLSFSALMQYQLVLAEGFQRQWQQRAAWRTASQVLAGNIPADWQTLLQRQSGPAGCQLLTAQAISPAGLKAELTQLDCSPAVRTPPTH